MKNLILLLLFGFCFCERGEDMRNLLSTDSSVCRSCVDSGSQNWGTTTGSDPTSGEGCNTGVTAGYCSGASTYACSNSSDIQSNGGLILCPNSTSNGGTRSRSLGYIFFSSENIVKSSLSVTSVGVYRIYVLSTALKSGEIEITDLVGANISIFTAPRDENKYTHEGSMSKGDKKSFSLDPSNDIYIVVEPTSSTNSIDIKAVSSISSLTSTSNNSGVIVGIILGSICGVCILAGVVCMGCRGHRAKRMRKQRENTIAQLNQNKAQQNQFIAQPGHQMNQETFQQVNNTQNPSYITPVTATYNPSANYPAQYTDPATIPNNPYTTNPNATAQPQIAGPVYANNNGLNQK